MDYVRSKDEQESKNEMYESHFDLERSQGSILPKKISIYLWALKRNSRFGSEYDLRQISRDNFQLWNKTEKSSCSIEAMSFQNALLYVFILDIFSG